VPAIAHVNSTAINDVLPDTKQRLKINNLSRILQAVVDLQRYKYAVSEVGFTGQNRFNVYVVGLSLSVSTSEDFGPMPTYNAAIYIALHNNPNAKPVTNDLLN